MKFLLCVCSLAILLLSPSLQAEDAPAMVFENLGLRNNYRVIISEWDDANHFAKGAFEISDNTDDSVHTRIPFAAEVKPDPKDKKTELLLVRCTAIYFFFAPGDKKEPFPPLTWKLTGRKTNAPTLKASLWTFGKSSWGASDMDFEKAAK